jgi:hypothetical protein
MVCKERNMIFLYNHPSPQQLPGGYYSSPTFSGNEMPTTADPGRKRGIPRDKFVRGRTACVVEMGHVD